MSGNIANGGLVAKWRETVIFARPNEWFLNTDNEFIYYSDRTDRNRLYRKRSASDEGQPIIKEPCSYVTLFGDGVYYVNEDQMKVYRCSKDGKSRVCCSSQSAAEFGILGDGGVYVNPTARRLCVRGSLACFSDTSNNFALTVLDIENNLPKAFSDVKPSHINIHENNIYYTDRTRGNAIFRLDPSGNRLSVFSTASECLHIIDEWLYFISDKKWKRLSLLNFGEAEEV